MKQIFSAEVIRKHLAENGMPDYESLINKVAKSLSEEDSPNISLAFDDKSQAALLLMLAKN